jgi:hypothetical protein
VTDRRVSQLLIEADALFTEPTRRISNVLLEIDYIDAPGITSLTPDHGAVSDTVTIAGSNFRASQGTGTVTFNGTEATVTSWSDTEIEVTVPEGATTGDVVVTDDGGTASAGATWTLDEAAAPEITSIDPDHGRPGDTVTVTGTGFGETEGYLIFAKDAETPVIATIISWSDTEIVATVPDTDVVWGVGIFLSDGVTSSNTVTWTLDPAPAASSPTGLPATVGSPCCVGGCACVGNPCCMA